MPPKRKRSDEGTSAGTATTRATRVSTRSQTKSTQVESSSSTNTPVSSKDSDMEIEPPIKKSRNTTTKSSRRATAKGRTKKRDHDGLVDDPQCAGSNPEVPKRSNTGTKQAHLAAKDVSQLPPEPYSVQHALDLFDKYADEDNRDVIGPRGFEMLCNDAGIAMDGAIPLLLAWQLGTTEMGRITKLEWEKGTNDLRISSVDVLAQALRHLEDLLISNKTKAKSTGKTIEPYNRSRYYRYARDVKKAYQELYMFCFMLVKPSGSRSIDMETASAIWSVIVASKYPIMNDVLEFVVERGTYKGVNKDLWNMTLEFCETVTPGLDGYDPDGAWPTMLDEFVGWKRQRIELAI